MNAVVTQRRFLYDNSMKKLRALLLLTLFCCLGACQSPISRYHGASKDEINAEIRTQKEMAFQQRIKETSHLYGIFFNIIRKNAALCSKTKYSLGFSTWNINTLSGEQQEIAENLYGLDHVHQVHEVYPGTDAAQHIQVGDKIIAINGTDVSSSKKHAKAIKSSVKDDDEEIEFLMLRGDMSFTFKPKAYKVCDYKFHYQYHAPEINAYANGTTVIYARGMYRFNKTDEEIANIIGHEVGHNLMKHVQKSTINRFIAKAGILLTDLIMQDTSYLDDYYANIIVDAATNIYSVEFEREADYIGMYFAERAGYDMHDAINLWRRMAVEISAESIDKRSSHPATAERFIYLQKTYDEIQDKKTKGQALIPNIDWAKTGLDVDLVHELPPKPQPTYNNDLTAVE